MKTYQKNEILSRNTTSSNFVFSEDQKLVLENLDKQMRNIHYNHISKNVKTHCVVHGNTGPGKSTIIHAMVKRLTNRFGCEAFKIAAYTVNV